MNRRVAGAGLLGVAVLVGYEVVIRPWQQRWGATEHELGMRLPGDELVAEPAGQVTRAITIDAALADVWPRRISRHVPKQAGKATETGTSADGLRTGREMLWGGGTGSGSPGGRVSEGWR